VDQPRPAQQVAVPAEDQDVGLEPADRVPDHSDRPPLGDEDRDRAAGIEAVVQPAGERVVEREVGAGQPPIPAVVASVEGGGDACTMVGIPWRPWGRTCPSMAAASSGYWTATTTLPQPGSGRRGM
jgi:hypothetical protein